VPSPNVRERIKVIINGLTQSRSKLIGTLILRKTLSLLKKEKKRITPKTKIAGKDNAL